MGYRTVRVVDKGAPLFSPKDEFMRRAEEIKAEILAKNPKLRPRGKGAAPNPPITEEKRCNSG